MCGIFGVVAKDKNKYREKDIKKIIEILFKLSESRGKEAAGLAVKKEGSINILKSPVGASAFLKNKSYKKFSDNVFKEMNGDGDKNFLAIIGHARLATHGTEYSEKNNQPVIKGKMVCVHNGIIANDKQLWEKFPMLKRESEVDTEVFLSLLELFFSETKSIFSATKKAFETIEGSASVAILFNDNQSLLLATNTGSLFVCNNTAENVLVFASERYILEQLIEKTKRLDSFEQGTVQQISPGKGLAVDVRTLNRNGFSFSDEMGQLNENVIVSHPETKLIVHPSIQNTVSFTDVFTITKDSLLSPETKKNMHEIWNRIYSNDKLRRCTKCLLPETMTFIDFDEQGVCNYCRHYKKIQHKGKTALEEIISKYRRRDGKPNCLLPFSGGRDSSYGLHYFKSVLKMNPIAFTYDWGMMTDSGRKNEARMCGKLGVEHIILSADIRKKRRDIRKNLEAWLRRPELGMVPLLMAGDKDMMYYINFMKKRTKMDLMIDCYGRGLEDDLFKIGFAGIRLNPEEVFLDISIIDKLNLAKYYAIQYILNPFYINSSLFETIRAYFLAFFHSYKALHLYDYIRWDEKEILSTIIDKYGWEKEKDTVATWRIDDGTAAIYNYIYMTMAGFTEFDTFRSIQIREGQLSREDAYNLIKEENKPRYESLEWYCRIIGVDCNKTINRINSVPKLYELPRPTPPWRDRQSKI